MHPVIRVILQRLALGLLTLLAISVVIFSALEILPGGFAESILGQNATPELIANLNHEIGLDRPAAVRYVEWIGGVLHGDFGYSYASLGSDIAKRSVTDIIAPRLYNTMFLASMAAVIAVPIALLLGVLTALYRNTWFDRIMNSAALSTVATPEFFIAYVLLYFFAIKHRWFYSLSTIRDTTDFAEHVYRAALPTLTLTLVIVAYMMRMTRAAIIDVLSSPYMEMARLKGTPGRAAILHHALPNAWSPILTVIAFSLAYLVVGVVVVEVVFVYPGVGQLMVDSVTSRDMPVVQACVLIFAATYVLLNLTADILSIVTNPRLLHKK